MYNKIEKYILNNILSFDKGYKMKKSLFSAIFCPPTGEWEERASTLNDYTFLKLKEAGIKKIFGFGMDEREDTIIATLKLCEKYEIDYLISLPVFNEYVRVDDGKFGEKPYSSLSEIEKTRLDKKFIRDIKKYYNYKAFKGIFFEDEAGYLAFPAVIHAKSLFDKHFPDFEFHINFYSYSINEKIFWGGIVPAVKPFELKGDLEISFENRFHYYDCYVEGLLSKSTFKYISQDKYPFENFWPSVPTSVHKALFELNSFFKLKSKKYGCKYYNYMQVGQWYDKDRDLTFAEMALQMNVTIAYGADGFAFFPGVFPLDWMKEERFSKARQGGCAFIDGNGLSTIYIEWTKKLFSFYKNFEDDILSAEFIGIEAFGKYDNGFSFEDVQSLPDNECIFVGELPDFFRISIEGIRVECSNEVSVSLFENKGAKRYFVVNLSTVYKNDLKLELPEGEYVLYANEKVEIIKNVVETTLDKGQAIYIKERENRT